MAKSGGGRGIIQKIIQKQNTEGFMKVLRHLKLIAGIISMSCMLAPLPVKAEWSFDEQYIKEKFQTFLRSTIEEAELKETPPYINGVSVRSLIL